MPFIFKYFFPVKFEPGRSKDLYECIGHEETDVDPTQVRLWEVELRLEHDLEESDRFPEKVAEAVRAPGQGEGPDLSASQSHGCRLAEGKKRINLFEK